jgi:hypothetical protein
VLKNKYLKQKPLEARGKEGRFEKWISLDVKADTLLAGWLTHEYMQHPSPIAIILHHFHKVLAGRFQNPPPLSHSSPIIIISLLTPRGKAQSPITKQKFTVLD